MIINFNFPAPKSYFLWSNKSRKKFHGVELGKKSNLGNVTFAAQIIPIIHADTADHFLRLFLIQHHNMQLSIWHQTCQHSVLTLVPNCVRCQIVRGAKLSAVPNCPIIVEDW